MPNLLHVLKIVKIKATKTIQMTGMIIYYV